MQNKFTTSINIQRDFNKDLKYIATANVKSIFNQLVNGFQTGIHSFNIIGSYGTGKSSFILAFEKNLNNKIEYFAKVNGQFNGIKKFEFINIIGEYSSLEKTIKKELGEEGERDTIEILNDYYNKVSKENKFLLFVIDEFGKFLEFASKNNPDKELYFIQKLAEFANDINKNIILLTTLHQDFSTYSGSLDFNQRKEWDKVKGRFKELAFNEPVEQLLFLAAEYIDGKKQISNRVNFNKLFNIIKGSNIISLSDSIDINVAEKLFPLDLLSSSILTLSLQRYGQNERSLFTFLYSEDTDSYNVVKNNGSLFSLDKVYNYLINNFYSILNTPILNPDGRQWASIREAIEKIEGFWSKDIVDAVKIVKCIGLLNAFSTYKSSVSKDFLVKYADLSLNIKSSAELIDKLEQSKIIRYAEYRSQYILVSGTDMDINKEIEEAGAFVDKDTDIIPKLKEYINFPYIPAKAIQYETGTPRFFEFVISEEPINLIPQGEIDGFVNIIFGVNLSSIEVEDFSKQQENAILYAYFKESKSIYDILFQIDKISYVINNADTDDRVAIKELNRQKYHEITKLNNYIKENLFESRNISWYYKGKQVVFKNKTDFNKFLSDICRNVYDKTAIYKNESVNKHKISTTISSARKNLFNALLNNWDKENLGIDKFPPEKAVYLTLLNETGIHRKKSNGWYMGNPHKDSGLADIWKVSEDFFEKAKNKKRNLIELVEMLSERPYKLKQGFIDFWLPLFLFLKREDFALFFQDNYIPDITLDIADLLNKSIKDFSVKTYNIAGPKLELFNEYRRLINLDEKEQANQKGLVETIKPFLIFYKQLPDYTKQTKDLSRNALRLREAIAKAKEPVETFFDAFPKAIGFKDLNLKSKEDFLPEFLTHLKSAIKELRTSLNDYFDYLEMIIVKEQGIKDKTFEIYKKQIIKRYKPIKSGLLSNNIKVFFNRLNSPIEERNAWIDSLVQILMGKRLDKIVDEEKNMLEEKLIDSFRELDKLIPVHKVKKTNKKDQIIKFDITTEKGTRTNQFIVSENKIKEVEELESKVLTLLQDEKDNLIKKAAIIKILQKGINND